jgi:hypothetical protein
VERFQYVEGWPSGYGADQALAAAAAEPRRPLRLVVDRLGHSTLFFVLRSALANDPGVEVTTADLDSPRVANELVAQARRGPVLVVLSKRRGGVAPKGLRLELLRALIKPGGDAAGSLWRVPAPPPTA